MLSIECGAAAIALDIHIKNGGVAVQAIDGGVGSRWTETVCVEML
jgi:hypothetical protein